MGDLCFCTLAHTPKFCHICLHPSLGSRWCLFIPCRAGFQMVMNLTEECKKNHEKERARLNDTPTAKSQWCQFLEKHVQMHSPPPTHTKILLTVPILLPEFFLHSFNQKPISKPFCMYTPKSSCMYHMPSREKVSKTLTLCLDMKRKRTSWNFSAKSFYWEWLGRSEEIIFSVAAA